MSYILEALKKSEQDRQEQNSASLTQYYETQSATPNRSGPNAWWAVGLLAVALVVLLLMVWWWHSKPANHTTHSQTTRSPIAQSSPQLPAPVVQLQPASQQAEHKQTEPKTDAEKNVTADTTTASKAKPIDPRIAQLYKQPQTTQAQITEPKPQAVSLQPDQVSAAQPVSATPTAPKPNSAKPNSAKQSSTTQQSEQSTNTLSTNQSNFLSIDELPDTIKSELFPIHYIAHVYSDSQKQGFAILNDIRLRPGDQFAKDFYLEKVATDHVIMSYRGYFFRLEAMQDWEGF